MPYEWQSLLIGIGNGVKQSAIEVGEENQFRQRIIHYTYNYGNMTMPDRQRPAVSPVKPSIKPASRRPPIIKDIF